MKGDPAILHQANYQGHFNQLQKGKANLLEDVLAKR